MITAIAQQTDDPVDGRNAIGRPSWKWGSPKGCAALAVVALVAIELNTWGLSWGLPAVVSWAPDTIAGTRTLYTMGKWPDRWPGHYPPFHFFINQLAYRPVLSHWQANGLMTTHPETGAPVFAPPVAPKIGLLIMVSRVITVIMSVGAVLALAFVAAALFDDPLGGLFAALTFATCAEWVFFSHLGNLDIPHMFWFVLSLYAYVRAWRTDAAWAYALLGLLAALSMSTKDAVAGALAGMAVVLAVTRVLRARSAGRSPAGSLLSAVHPKMLLGLACCVVPYALVQGIFASPSVYLNRMGFYLGGPGITDFNEAYQGPLWLAREALAVSAKGLGWPMFGAMIVATVYGLWRWRRQSLAVVVPVIAYYLIVPSYTHTVYARMLFPAYACLAVLVGRACVDWLACKPLPAAVRYGVVCLFFALSLGYSSAVGLEMAHDTRYQAERWIAQNIEEGESIGVFSHQQYLPRFLPESGFTAVPLEMTQESLALGTPNYVLLTSHNYQDFDGEQSRCLSALLDGAFGHTKVASFSPRYLPPARSWVAIAGWGTRGAGKVSPQITILRRERRSSAN